LAAGHNSSYFWAIGRNKTFSHGIEDKAFKIPMIAPLPVICLPVTPSPDF
jgi:hypothetical protein